MCAGEDEDEDEEDVPRQRGKAQLMGSDSEEGEGEDEDGEGYEGEEDDSDEDEDEMTEAEKQSRALDKFRWAHGRGQGKDKGERARASELPTWPVEGFSRRVGQGLSRLGSYVRGWWAACTACPPAPQRTSGTLYPLDSSQVHVRPCFVVSGSLQAPAGCAGCSRGQGHGGRRPGHQHRRGGGLHAAVGTAGAEGSSCMQHGVCVMRVI